MGDGHDRDLRELVAAGDIDGALAFCRSAERIAALPDRAAVFVDCARIIRGDTWSGDQYSHQQGAAAVIAATAVGTFAELSKLPMLPVPYSESAVELLAGRDLSFRSAWVGRAFDDLHPLAIRVARRLIATGLAAKPSTDNYWIALAGMPGIFDLSEGADRPAGRHASTIDVLRRNPDLLDDVWRLFEVEGGGEHSLAAHDKYNRADVSWTNAFVTLATEGALDRDRLLDESLAALDRGFAQFRVGWFSAFHEALTPTPDERTARADRYLALASSPIGPTVTMALAALTVVAKQGALDGHRAVDGLGLALLTPAKGSALKALKLIVASVRSDPALVPLATHRVAAALGHPAADVQQAAVTQLRNWHPDGPADVAEEVRRLQPGCHAAVRDHIDEWLGAVSDFAVAAVHVRVPYEMIPSVPVTKIDWLAPDRAIVPIADTDEFFECASSALENPPSPDAIERLITFVATSGRGIRSTGLASTLARRAGSLVARSERASQVLLGEIIMAALGQPVAQPRPLSYHRPAHGPLKPTCIDQLLVMRVRALAEHIADGAPFTPLASPTHHGGHIDPLSFAERLQGSTWKAAAPEMMLAMLRLAPAPDRLDQAADILGGLSHRKIRRHLGQWAGHCAADATRPVSWTPNVDESDRSPRLPFELSDGVVETDGMTEAIMLRSHQWGTLSGVFTQDPAGVRWVASSVPALVGSWAEVGVLTIGSTVHVFEVAHGDPALLDRYFDPLVPIADAGALLLALTLNDARRPVSSVAVDLAIVSIDQRRVDVDRLGQHIGLLMGTGWVTPPRWARTLADVAGHGPLHADAVVQVLERAIAVAQPRALGDLLALLELFESLLLEQRRHIDDADVRAALARITGGSKTAKAASRLLALTGADSTGAAR